MSQLSSFRLWLFPFASCLNYEGRKETFVFLENPYPRQGFSCVAAPSMKAPNDLVQDQKITSNALMAVCCGLFSYYMGYEPTASFRVSFLHHEPTALFSGLAQAEQTIVLSIDLGLLPHLPSRSAADYPASLTTDPEHLRTCRLQRAFSGWTHLPPLWRSLERTTNTALEEMAWGPYQKETPFVTRAINLARGPDCPDMPTMPLGLHPDTLWALQKATKAPLATEGLCMRPLICRQDLERARAAFLSRAPE